MNITCIIPFFNESDRIEKVLEEVVKIKKIDEIICVDDGSADGASDFIRKDYPEIKLIINPKNLGKTDAIRIGLEHARGEYVLLLDADLRNFDHKEIENAVRKTLEDNIDMVILRRINAPFIIKINRGDTLLSGERILRRSDLLETILTKKPKGYQLEFAINQYMMDHNKKVFWITSSALNTYKFYKKGFIRGLYEPIAVTVDIIKYAGIKDYIKQVLFFCRNELT